MKTFNEFVTQHPAVKSFDTLVVLSLLKPYILYCGEFSKLSEVSSFLVGSNPTTLGTWEVADEVSRIIADQHPMWPSLLLKGEI